MDIEIIGLIVLSLVIAARVLWVRRPFKRNERVTFRSDKDFDTYGIKPTDFMFITRIIMGNGPMAKIEGIKEYVPVKKLKRWPSWKV
ncbi:MAG: hypothetical protein AAB515_04010 [Patescibacteria group bacterium]|mgnify:CR=1 FL=1